MLYLVFNEGYTATSGPNLQRTDLAEEAIRIAQMVHGLLPAEWPRGRKRGWTSWPLSTPMGGLPITTSSRLSGAACSRWPVTTRRRASPTAWQRDGRRASPNKRYLESRAARLPADFENSPPSSTI
jgi:hypothetical protein